MLDNIGDPDFVTRILLVEDNPIDVKLLRLAFEKDLSWRTFLTFMDDGEKVIEYLKQSRDQGQEIDFVILDLNLPKVDGVEVLTQIRQTEGLQELPVAILSSSPMDVIHSKIGEGGISANGYFTKPVEIERFWGLTKTLHECFRSASNS